VPSYAHENVQFSIYEPKNGPKKVQMANIKILIQAKLLRNQPKFDKN
jgi:hypothetical protein